MLRFLIIMLFPYVISAQKIPNDYPLVLSGNIHGTFAHAKKDGKYIIVSVGNIPNCLYNARLSILCSDKTVIHLRSVPKIRCSSYSRFYLSKDQRLLLDSCGVKFIRFSVDDYKLEKRF